MKIACACLALVLLTQTFTFAQNAPVGEIEWKDAETGVTGYTLVPENYSPKKKYTLVVFNHGVGGSGKGFCWHWNKWFIKDDEKKDWIIILPTCTAVRDRKFGDTQNLQDTAKATNRKVREALQQYNINPTRIILGGYSGGGSSMMHTYQDAPELYRFLFALAAHYRKGGWPEDSAKRAVFILWGENDKTAYSGGNERYEFYAALKGETAAESLEKHILKDAGHDLPTPKNFERVAELFRKWYEKSQPAVDKQFAEIDKIQKEKDKAASDELMIELKAAKDKTHEEINQTIELSLKASRILFATDDIKKLSAAKMEKIDGIYERDAKKMFSAIKKEKAKSAESLRGKLLAKWSDVPYFMEKLKSAEAEIAAIEKK
jgi:predicted esterase